MNNEKLIPVGTKVRICLPDKDPYNYKISLDNSGNMFAYDGKETKIIQCDAGYHYTHYTYKLGGCCKWNWSDDMFVICDAPKTFGELISMS